ncbi:F-box protein SKIP14 [Euphorbia peplus]|nr:F-box protein SKIP14 [Euphorbia peplus]
MALNFSRRPVFSGHLPEDSLVSPMRIANGYLVESKPDKVENCFDYGRDKSDRCGSQESVHKDILDLLPSDPFGMDISTTFTAITGWLEDLEADYGGYGRDQVSTSDGNYQLFAGLNFIWNNAMRFQSFPGSMSFDNSWNAMGGFSDGCSEIGDTSSHGALGMAFNIDDILSFGNELMANKTASSVVCKGEVSHEGGELSSDGDGGAPHTALAFSFSYLGVRDLMIVETVCKSLRSTVRSDPLLWRSIHIDQPLNEKITDDVLLQLTNRAQGNLQCLSLIECPRITDDGLKNVLDNNPRLTTLSVPGCTKLSIEGIVTSLKAFKATGAHGVKHLRIGGLYGVTEKHFEELKFLLGMDESEQCNTRKPHFYRRGNFYLSCDDDRIIDIEACPRCQNLRLVYDCPAEGCQPKDNPSPSCRACTLCIARCVQCGRCINDSEYEETFCLELLCSDCSDCWKQLLKCQETQERKISHPMPSALYDSGCSHRIHG